MEPGNVKLVNIVTEMTGAYLDYSMSVIVSRALPDVRDGLKPVHRRVLYAMDQMGLQSHRTFRKCAGTVGEVLKSYHPHGDKAVYDSPGAYGPALGNALSFDSWSGKLWLTR